MTNKLLNECIMWINTLFINEKSGYVKIKKNILKDLPALKLYFKSIGLENYFKQDRILLVQWWASEKDFYDKNDTPIIYPNDMIYSKRINNKWYTIGF